MKLKFSKPYKEEMYGLDQVKVNGREFALHMDGTLDYIEGEPSDFSPEYAHMTLDAFNALVNNMFKEHNASTARRRAIRDVAISPSHWYRTLQKEKKIELVGRVRDITSDIVASFITRYPDSKLNDYYLSLVGRATYGTIEFPDLLPKDIAKLPVYDETIDKLMGTPQSFLKLIAVVYAPTRRKGKYTITC